MRQDVVTVEQLRTIIKGAKGDRPLRCLGLEVERIDPYGRCSHCGCVVDDEYNCCTRCADEHGP